MPSIQEEIRDEIAAQGKILNEFRASHEKELAELKASGTASAETLAAVEKTNNALQDVTNRIRDLETRQNRPGNEASDIDPKAAAIKKGFFNALRGRPVDLDVQNALIEDATGQILVPEDVEAGIIRTRADETVMRRLATVRTTTSDRVRRRSMTELQVGWGKLETGDSLVESTPTPSNATVNIEDLMGLVRIGIDELMDTDVNLEGYVDDSFGRAIADKEETGFVLGLGHSSDQPEGFTLGSTVARIVAGQASAIKADDFFSLMYGVKSSYRRNGAFLVNSSTELAMRKLKDSDGQYLWQPSLQIDTPTSFAGRPVYNQDDLSDVHATLQKDVAAFGDWKAGYVIVDRMGMKVQRLNELYATTGMVGFLAHFRVTGYVADAEALRILRVPASS